MVMTFEKSIERKFTFLRRQMLALLVVLLVLLVIMIAIIGNQFALIKTMTDAMDQLNYIRQEIEAAEPEPVPEVEEPTACTLTPKEFDLVCRVVMSESGGEGLQAQMAVAQTICDRMNDFGDSLPEAIRTYSKHDNGKPTDSVRLAVANVFEGGMRVYEGGTYQFHDDSVNPYWTAGKIDRGSIGKLRFYGGYEHD